MREEAFLRERFGRFYASQTVHEPPLLERREFGLGVFGKKISQRHLAFRSYAELNDFLRHEIPFFVSYSAAYYQDPAARPMEAKHWQGADLVFEFDADDLKTDCKRAHDSWQCAQCKSSGKGNPEACTNCGSAVKVQEWVCPLCLGSVHGQVDELLKLLENDLGFSEGIAINFSGSKGFHVHVRSALAKQLSPEARVEVLDFLTGQGLDLEQLGFAQRNKSLYGVPLEKAKGWQKRILQGLLQLVEKGDSSALAVAGNVSVRTAEKVLEKKETVAENIRRGFFPTGFSSKPLDFWRQVLLFVANDLKLDIDRQTSLDKFKIVRLPQTLHGSTGLLAKNVPFSEWPGFLPLQESVVLGTAPVMVIAQTVPRFFLKDQWFGPFTSETVELPEFAAVFLLARGAAVLPENPK